MKGNLGDITENKLGLYEKALPKHLSWDERLHAAKKAGYDFVEISIDETDDRQARLEWDASKKLKLKEAIFKHDIPILTMCLSGNRRYPIGSEDETIRRKGIELIKKAIDFSLDIGVRLVQIAGYDEFGRPSTEKTKSNFIASLKECAAYAKNHAVMLAFETMEIDMLDSICKAEAFVSEINSPWFKIYPDIGNMTATAQDIEKDFMSGKDNVVAIHLKDTKLGVVRDIGYGEGIVDFVTFFKLLKREKYSGLFVAEMWTDESDESYKMIKDAREFLVDKMEQSKQ